MERVDTRGRRNERELPPQAEKNIRCRYGRVRWLGYIGLVMVGLHSVLDPIEPGPLVTLLVIVVAIFWGSWYFAPRALRLARHGELVQGTVVDVHRPNALVKAGTLFAGAVLGGLEDITFEYSFNGRAYRNRKSVHRAYRLDAGQTIEVVVDPDKPRRCMLMIDLLPRMLKS